MKPTYAARPRLLSGTRVPCLRSRLGCGPGRAITTRSGRVLRQNDDRSSEALARRDSLPSCADDRRSRRLVILEMADGCEGLDWRSPPIHNEPSNNIRLGAEQDEGHAVGARSFAKPKLDTPPTGSAVAECR